MFLIVSLHHTTNHFSNTRVSENILTNMAKARVKLTRKFLAAEKRAKKAAKKARPKRPPNTWIRALQKFNRGQKKWCIPQNVADNEDYTKVMEMKRDLQIAEAVAKSKSKKKKVAEIAAAIAKPKSKKKKRVVIEE